MGRLKWWLYSVWLSAQWMFQVNIGDEVWYRGQRYTVANGVRTNSWRLPGIENGDDGWVPRSECRKVLTPVNALGSFKSGYRFYTGYWLDIWTREGIQDWMRGCNIWPRRPKPSPRGKAGGRR